MKQQSVPFFEKNHQETHQVYRRALHFKLNKRDSFEVENVEGDQAVYLIAIDESNQSALQAVGLGNNYGTLDGLLNEINIDDTALSSIRSLSQLGDVEVASLFPQQCKAGDKKRLQALQEVECYVLSDDSYMSSDQHHPSTQSLLKITRETTNRSDETPLPPPLAQPIDDFRVAKSSALAYRVKAGQYIQIIDVEGHQCSDFQAFAKSDLDSGVELGISPTVTRTFMQSSFSSPGVHDKYYNINSVPLVEVVHDTVNRHDTFGLACNAKYYEDMGYPGHINCTDNFNKVLAPFGFKPRLNWITLNLFFNTAVEESHTISADVSWSRAGDYVLFKALQDVVCVSSACPDDINPSNNWNPTDIHIRIYDADNDFKQAQSFRPTANSLLTMTKNTGFHQKTQELTRNFSEYNGYWLANDYTNYGAIKEYWACRESVVMMDLSALRKFEVYGQDAEKLMHYALPRNIKKLAIGQVVYTSICYENGGMIDDGTLYRFGKNNFRWICGNDYSGIWLRKLAEKNDWHVWVKSSTDDLHNIALQGPKSRDVLRKFLWTPKTQATADELGWFRFSIGRMYEDRGIPIVVSRTGYTGELGYEIFCHPNDASEVWQNVWEAGAEFGIAPLGLEALDLLRIEAGLIFAGYEFCDQTDPFEAGIGFSVPASKEDDFVGKEALLRRKQNPTQKLVGLELETSEEALHGDGVFIDRQQVGVITSGCRSPILNKNIALCRISVNYAEVGTEIEIGKLDGHQKRLKARVVSFPFYDPEKTRVRS